MGLASYPVGFAPFAADPVAAPSARVVQPPILAARFDGASRVLLQNADGTIAGVHPVDQEVALALSLEDGAIASLSGRKGVGHRIRRLKRAQGPTVVADVQDAVRYALRRVLARNDITIVSIDVDNTTVRGRIVVAVSYVNLRLNPPAANAPPPNVTIARVTT